MTTQNKGRTGTRITTPQTYFSVVSSLQELPHSHNTCSTNNIFSRPDAEAETCLWKAHCYREWHEQGMDRSVSLACQVTSLPHFLLLHGISPQISLPYGDPEKHGSFLRLHLMPWDLATIVSNNSEPLRWLLASLNCTTNQLWSQSSCFKKEVHINNGVAALWNRSSF